MNQNLFKKVLIFLVAIFLLIACSVEHKIAKSFVLKKDKGAVIILSPDAVFKTNLKDTIAGSDTITTQFLQKIDEYALIGLSLLHLKKGTKKYWF